MFNKCRALPFFILLVIASSSLQAKEVVPKGALDIGLLPVGQSPSNLKMFKSTDCSLRKDGFGDCSGVDRDGVKYVFFDGRLSKVSIKRSDANSRFRLPFGLNFGCQIDESAAHFTRLTGFGLVKTVAPSRNVVAASDFVIPSSSGALTSIELISDNSGKLVEIVQRVDF